MPNWCYNETVFYGDKKVLQRFKDDLVDATSKSPKKFVPVYNSWENMWLGNVFLAAGYAEKELEGINCRGGIIDIDYEDNFISLHYDSAWRPIYEDFDMMLEEKYPGLCQVTLAEEPNMDVYVNTDKEGLYFTDRYLIDCCIVKDGEEKYYNKGFTTEDALVDFVNRLYETSFKSFDEIEKGGNKINDAHNGDEEFFIVNEYASE